MSAVDAARLARPGGDLADLIRLYESERRSVERFHNLPWSEAAMDRTAALYRDWQGALERMDFAGLGQEGKVDYLLLQRKLVHELASIDLDRRRLGEMDGLLPFRRDILTLETARRAMERINPEPCAGTLSGMPDQVKKIRERLEKGQKQKDEAKGSKPDAKPDAAHGDSAAAPAESAAPAPAPTPPSAPATPDPDGPIKISAVVALRTAGAVDALRGTLGEWYRFYAGYEPTFTWWVRAPFDKADDALEEYAKFLRETLAGIKGKDEDPLVGDPIGAAALAADMSEEMLAYSPEELIAIAEQEFAWCEAEMKKAAAEMGLVEEAGGWKAALARVKADHPPPGEQDDLVTELARGAIKFVKDRDLVTVPPLCDETWRLTMISPEGQKSLPFAAYGGQNMMVAYPTDGMKHDDKLMSMRGNNRHFTRIVAPHELIPGHHLQGFIAQRVRPYRGLFSTPFYVEGWALHWEMLLWDLGYAQGPEDRIGMLFWRMHRCARIIVSLKFHLGQMTPQEMVDFLVDRVGHERFGATSEVRRFIGGNYSPLYQCGYMIGGMQIRSLYTELVGDPTAAVRAPGRMTPKRFHDAVLECNAMPIEMVRASLMGTGLTQDAKAEWRFAGEVPVAPGPPTK